MKRDVAAHVAMCDVCQRVKAEHQRPAGLLHPLKIPEWKWEEIGMDFIVGLPRTSAGYDSIWVIVDRLTKVAHFIPVAIARAILKDAPIVILDEATAFTDPENEDKIQRSIMALSRGKTLLVIAHRLSTIQNADQIVVLEKGSVADCGTQEELLGRCPLYQTLWTAHVGARNWAVTSGKKEGN